MNKHTIKYIICLIVMLVGFLSLFTCVITSFVFNVKNPDMTEMRLLIENPKPVIGAIISTIAIIIADRIICKK